MKHLQDLHVLVLGLGASGLAMARWCARHGSHVTVADTREAPPQLATLQQDVPGAVFVGGPFTAALVEGTPVRAVYRSPGLSPEAIGPVVEAARAIGLPVGGELDLFAQALADLRVAPEAVAEESTEEPTPVAPEAAAEAEAVTAEPADDDVEADLEVAVALAEDAQDEEEAEAAEIALAPLPLVVPPEVPKGYTPAVLAITGTNGKTTVTALTGQLVERAGKTVAVAGNIGPTLLDTLAAHIDADTLPQVWVLELSSFQLDGVQGFEPTAAVVLNVTQDHLDWHGDMTAYAAAKARVFGARGLMILNRDAAAVMAMLPPPIRAKLQRPQIRTHVTFGATMPLRPGDYGIEQINGMGWLVRALEADETQKRKRGAVVEEEIFMQRLMPANALRIRGQHNALNALAALALATAAGCQLAPMLYGLREYRGEPHRVESVTTVDEVEYFDDSKGTNVGATVAALNGLGAERKVVVILGGEGKGQDFSPLAEPVRNFARAVVLIGRDAPLITEALASTGVPLVQAASMDEAVQLAARSARPSDAVLLSPACASFDMFRDYGHRAAVFCDAVQALADSPRETSGRAGMNTSAAPLHASDTKPSRFGGWFSRAKRSIDALPIHLPVHLGSAGTTQTKAAPMRVLGFDQALVWVTIALLAWGLVMVYSASIALPDNPRFIRQGYGPLFFLTRHIASLIVAFIAALLTFQIPMKTWERAAPWLFVVSLLLLVAVLIPHVGISVNGARRWLPMGFMRFQPSELAKVAMVLYAASYMVRKMEIKERFFRAVLPMGIAVVVVGMLLLAEPDMGAFMVIAVIAMGILFLGGVNARMFFVIAMLVVVAFASIVASSSWRRERIFAYLDPWSEHNALGKGYQLSHSLIAIGRGEIWGVGLGGSVEKLHWLPEAHTDFLMAVIGEEFGLVGVLLAIGLFLWLTRRVMHIGRQAIALDRVFSGLVAQGIGIWIGFQTFINMGVNLGALPTKGLTLPLMSFGGSAILFNLIALAIVLRIDYENRVLMRGGRV